MNQEIWGICVDHPPLAPLLLAGIRAMLGESTLVLRLLPAIAGAATVFLAGKIAQRLGGQLTSHVIAALAVFTVPVYGVMFGYYSMNAFEILFWVGAVYVVTVLQAKDAPRLWLLFGLLAGIGLQNKHTFVLFAGGLVLGLLLHRRSIFRSHWFWFSGHNCYWLWGPGSWSGEVMIAVNVSLRNQPWSTRQSTKWQSLLAGFVQIMKITHRLLQLDD